MIFSMLIGRLIELMSAFVFFLFFNVSCNNLFKYYDRKLSCHSCLVRYHVEKTDSVFTRRAGSLPRHIKRSFRLRISSVNVTKSAGNCGFGHIY